MDIKKNDMNRKRVIRASASVFEQSRYVLRPFALNSRAKSMTKTCENHTSATRVLWEESWNIKLNVNKARPLFSWTTFFDSNQVQGAWVNGTPGRPFKTAKAFCLSLMQCLCGTPLWRFCKHIHSWPRGSCRPVSPAIRGPKTSFLSCLPRGGEISFETFLGLFSHWCAASPQQSGRTRPLG